VRQKSKFILDSTWNTMSAEARLKYQVCLEFAFAFAASSAFAVFSSASVFDPYFCLYLYPENLYTFASASVAT
jgi:hypothetical protein